MTYDSVRSATILIGGASPLVDDMWEWDGLGWSPVVYTGASPGTLEQVDRALVFDAARNRLVLFGGYDRSLRVRFDTTWEFQVQSAFRLPTLQGNCPGQLTATARSATPFGTVQFIMGNQERDSTIRGGACNGAYLGVHGGVTVLGQVQADANGNAVFSFQSPRNSCGKKLVAFDLSTCTASNVTGLE